VGLFYFILDVRLIFSKWDFLFYFILFFMSGWFYGLFKVELGDCFFVYFLMQEEATTFGKLQTLRQRQVT